jgi:hypothetical protein
VRGIGEVSVADEFDFDTGGPKPRQNYIHSFMVGVASRFVGNCLAIVVGFVIIFILLHIYGWLLLEAGLRMIEKSRENVKVQKPK